MLDSGSFIQGQSVLGFEAEFAAYIGTEHCIGVANGLDALTLILEAFKVKGDLRPGDSVIVPSNTYWASVLAVIRAGLVPVMAEPEVDTFNISSRTLQCAMTSGTKAVMAVHLYGRMAPMEDIDSWCKANGLLLIEDAAQAHGAALEGRMAGAWGHAAGFSFYPTKNLGAFGDGGAVTTDDADLARIVRQLANYGSDAPGLFAWVGINSRLDELQAALLRVALPHLDDWNKKRREIANAYAMGIKNPHVSLPALPQLPVSHVHHLYVVRCGVRDRLAAHLQKAGIGTKVHYPVSPHRQSAFRPFNTFTLPVAERLENEVLSLPLWPGMTPEQVRTVINAVNSFEG